MKTLLIVLMEFALSPVGAQVLFSESRPDAGLTLKAKPAKCDTVYIVLKDRIVQGIRRHETYACIYERTRTHEGQVFQGHSSFFIADKAGKYVQLVEPLAWRMKKPVAYTGDSVEQLDAEHSDSVLWRQ